MDDNVPVKKSPAETTGWAPTGAQLALELAQNPLTDDESFLQWVERHANRYIAVARAESWKAAVQRSCAEISGITVPSLADDGTWSARWRRAQPSPAHLINHLVEHTRIECTCGWIGDTMTEWTRHATGWPAPSPQADGAAGAVGRGNT